MKTVLFIIGLFLFLIGCVSTLQLESSQVKYSRWGFGRESPQEVANADLTMAWAKAIRQNPDLLRGYYYGYGWYGYYHADPCYYYPPGVCPVSGDVITKKEVEEIVEKYHRKGGGKWKSGY